MTKRPYEESPLPSSSEHLNTNPNTNNTTTRTNGLLPINDLLLSSTTSEEQQHQHVAAPSNSNVKRPRHFIAAVACETCRLKKTRCDESRPRCGLCKSLGLECVYNDRKATKRDQSLSMIISTLHRLETKLEGLPSAICDDMQSIVQGQVLNALEVSNTSRDASLSALLHNNCSTPVLRESESDKFDVEKQHQDAAQSTGEISISFSQHGVILWPGARKILPETILAAHEALGENYVVDYEMKRPPLPMYIQPFPPHAGERWLEILPVAVVKGLSDAFFTVFNPFTPIIDRNFYFAFTLGAAIESGFGYTMESCLVLNVMALGCLAVLAYREGDYPLPGTRSRRFEPPEWAAVIHEEPSGLRFFNEARRRIGFLMCENDIQSCQFYLLSSVYYNQILRPMDSWAMIHRAATCCLSMLSNRQINFDEWEGDMKSRVFWNCLMNETILVQELHLPPSGLSRLEEFVPIPKFIGFDTTGFVPAARVASSSELDYSLFQYHFLAQVAHRIILTRIRHSLYFFSDKGTFPLPAVNAELYHQLEQWRTNLPPPLQFPDIIPVTPTESTTVTTPMMATTPNTNTHTNTPASASPISPLPIDPHHHHHHHHRPISPAIAVADAMLRGRYKIAKFHIGRPYLYKAFRIPSSLTEDDLEQVRSGLRNAMDWPIIQGIFGRMKSCVPIKFAFCSQFFGQILLFYCISHSPDARLRDTLPLGWERWNEEMLLFLEDCAQYSPAVAKDLELLRVLV